MEVDTGEFRAITDRLDRLYDRLIDLATLPADLALQVDELRNDLRGGTGIPAPSGRGRHARPRRERPGYLRAVREAGQ